MRQVPVLSAGSVDNRELGSSQGSSVLNAAEEHGEDGEEKPPPKLEMVKELKEGDIFGELALISLKRRAATIVCLSKCELAVLDRATF